MSSEQENPLQVVDISEINQRTADELLNAATSQGFLFVEGHEFTEEEVDLLFKVSKDFFALPAEYKEKYPIDNTNHGYTNYGGENLDPSLQKQGDPKEALNFCNLDFTTVKFPTGSMKKKLDPKILALALKIEDSADCPGTQWFNSRYQPDKPSGSTFRFLHYPGQKSLNPESVIRAGAHTDYGSVTLLFQQENQEGLEIYSPVAKKWQPVPYVSANSAKFPVVNIADQLSYWTGGILKSTIHRVKFPQKVQETGQDRYSIVFFSHPNDDALLEPVPSEIVRSVKNRGANSATNVITAKEHLDKRLAATYGWSY
ncbi:hypothetical protein QCA50_019641 [Cerrena zonata]|uniref:Fe2OG dioxygenase domain-containing protein n=1 Tax=Cerrena zonata TaxID=2478898 RepID=A0AAW0F960_9APHY